MHKFLLILMVTGLVYGASCSNAAAPPVRVENTAPAKAEAAKNDHADDGHDAARITLADAKKDFDAGNAVLIDVRDEAAYRQEHIKDSINVTAATLTAKFNEIPKGKKIIAYCS